VKSVASVPLFSNTFPVNLLPTSDAAQQDVALHSGNARARVPGRAVLSKGIVSISGPDAAPAGSAWGLAREASFEFSVSN
jgi:hypothetical protein